MILVDTSVIKNIVIFGKESRPEIAKDPNTFKFFFLNKIIMLKHQFKCSKKNRMILTVDRKKEYNLENGEEIRGYWRSKYQLDNIEYLDDKTIGYKYGRRLVEDELDHKSIEKYYSEILEMLRKFSDIKVIECPGIEADDIIAVLAQRLTKTKTVIISIDKDLKLVNSETTQFFNYRNQQYENDVMSENERNVFYLCGDVSDAIKPCRSGTGKAKWDKLLLENNNSLEQCFKALDSKDLIDLEKIDKDLSKLSGKVDEKSELKRVKLLEKQIKLNKFLECDYMKRFEINKMLMDLSIESLPVDIQKEIIEEYKKEQGSFFDQGITSSLQKMQINECLLEGGKSLLDRTSEFALPKEANKNETKTYLKSKESQAQLKSIADRYL